MPTGWSAPPLPKQGEGGAKAEAEFSGRVITRELGVSTRELGVITRELRVISRESGVITRELGCAAEAAFSGGVSKLEGHGRWFRVRVGILGSVVEPQSH